MSKTREAELADCEIEEELGEYGKMICCKVMETNLISIEFWIKPPPPVLINFEHGSHMIKRTTLGT